MRRGPSTIQEGIEMGPRDELGRSHDDGHGAQIDAAVAVVLLEVVGVDDRSGGRLRSDDERVRGLGRDRMAVGRRAVTSLPLGSGGDDGLVVHGVRVLEVARVELPRTDHDLLAGVHGPIDVDPIVLGQLAAGHAVADLYDFGHLDAQVVRPTPEESIVRDRLKGRADVVATMLVDTRPSQHHLADDLVPPAPVRISAAQRSVVPPAPDLRLHGDVSVASHVARGAVVVIGRCGQPLLVLLQQGQEAHEILLLPLVLEHVDDGGEGVGLLQVTLQVATRAGGGRAGGGEDVVLEGPDALGVRVARAAESATLELLEALRVTVVTRGNATPALATLTCSLSCRTDPPAPCEHKALLGALGRPLVPEDEIGQQRLLVSREAVQQSGTHSVSPEVGW